MTTFKEVLNYKMTKKELVEYLEKNYTDEDNFVELEDLEFTKSDVNFSGMKVEGNLYQDSQTFKGKIIKIKCKADELGLR